ncbi:MAG TPA: hypothetical protein DIT13_08815 [Verrucomicrobiales bacterium]|nr:hypothetical protein [Verrucomicrobiales bacterium]
MEHHEASNEDHHRSKKNVRALLESAARVGGADAPVYFGAEWQNKLPAIRESLSGWQPDLE